MRDLLQKVILEVAKNENDHLMTQFGKGIFDMPELAFAYQCGKQMTIKLKEIYKNVNWQRECDFGQGGPTDLAFFVDDQLYLIEFKMDDTDQKYVRDLEKLTMPIKNSNYTIGGRFFCGLKWCIDSSQAKTFIDTVKSKAENLNVQIEEIDCLQTIVREKDQVCSIILVEVF